MDFLDAAIGFAIVMAICAGGITVFVEAIWRLFRIRKGNLISVLKQLDHRLAVMKGVTLGSRERWNLFCSILNNPLRAGMTGPNSSLPVFSDLKERPNLTPRFVSKLAFRRRDKIEARDNQQLIGEAIADTAIDALGRRHALAGTFDKVSAEHVARRYADAYARAGCDSDTLRDYLDKVIQNFESLTSSMSAEFKRRSQLVSIVIGILAALVFNINGLRIIDTFIAQPELSKAFATDLDQTESEVLGQIDAARNKLEDVTDSNNEKKLPSESITSELSTAVSDLESTVTGLSNRGVPVGWSYRPHCLHSKLPPCIAASENDGRAIPVDLLILTLTGVFIGLGAPFWFDVAKRLAMVRQMFGGTGNSLQAKSGRDANGSTESRKRIVEDIANSVGGERTMQLYKDYFNVPDGSKLEFRVTDENQKVRCRADLADEKRRIAEWVSEDIKDRDGAHFSPLSSGRFYVLTLDMTFEQEDTAAVSVQIVDSNGNVHGEPWNVAVRSRKERTHSASTTIMMA